MAVMVLRQSRDLLADDWAAMTAALSETAVRVPMRMTRLVDILTGREMPVYRTGRRYAVSAADCFASLPAAVLVPPGHEDPD